MYGAQAIEQGTTRSGRWLRERRLRFTLWIAAFEGLLYLFHALNWWAAVAMCDNDGVTGTLYDGNNARFTTSSLTTTVREETAVR